LSLKGGFDQTILQSLVNSSTYVWTSEGGTRKFISTLIQAKDLSFVLRRPGSETLQRNDIGYDFRRRCNHPVTSHDQFDPNEIVYTVSIVPSAVQLKRNVTFTTLIMCLHKDCACLALGRTNPTNNTSIGLCLEHLSIPSDTNKILVVGGIDEGRSTTAMNFLNAYRNEKTKAENVGSKEEALKIVEDQRKKGFDNSKLVQKKEWPANH
jgi:hypothetical protein